jgi:sulfate transport system permease protein
VSPRPADPPSAGGAVALPRPWPLRRPGAPFLAPALISAYLGVIVVIPLAAVVWKAQGLGWHRFWETITNPEAKAALELTLVAAVIVVAINCVFGTLLAWVLVRDSFPGKRVMDAVIDLPFALPTVVAGATLLAIYGVQSPVGIDVAFTRTAVVLAMLFETLPFVVRAVQPVLLEIDREVEEAAASLGARSPTIFRRIILPTILPAMGTGATLAFARCVGEFGAVVIISGNLPLRTEVASFWIFGQIESNNPDGAAAVSVVLLGISLLVLLTVNALQVAAARRADAH